MTPLEPNIEFVQAWGQLVPLLQSNPREAVTLLDDRDRQLLDWLKTHEHETGDAPEAMAVAQADWFMFDDVDVADNADQVLEFDDVDDLSGTTFLALDVGGAFWANHPEGGSVIRTRYIVTITAQLEDTDPGGWWDLRLEVSGDPSFGFIDYTRRLQRVERHNDGVVGISAAFLLVNPNPSYWRFVLHNGASSAIPQFIADDPGPVVSHQLVWWAFIDE